MRTLSTLAALLLGLAVVFWAPAAKAHCPGHEHCGEEPPPPGATLGDLSCTTDQIAKYDGTQWVCATICQNDPSLCAETKTVFITSMDYDGDLGGLSGADSICQAHADAAFPPLIGTYKAWLSDDTNSPSTRFTRSYNYTLVDGSKIARDWTDLTDGNIGHRMNVTEDGDTTPVVGVWTKSTVEGTVPSKSPLHHCLNWSAVSSGGTLQGGTGIQPSAR